MRKILFAILAIFPVLAPTASGQTAETNLLRIQYQIADPSFCQAATCVDYRNDGSRGIVLASRKTGEIKMLEAASGSVRWTRKLAGDQQSIAAYDLDGDGRFEILYSTSNPGRLYVLDGLGDVVRQWDAGDGKLGNSAVVLDADGDGMLDGYFGTRTKYLVRLDMADLTLRARRSGWVQCGCHTSAMDVDCDGRWDLFAGSGDDHRAKGKLVRFEPLSLDPVWQFDTDDNASSADAVLADIDGDSQVEIVKSVDNYAGDEAHDAVYALDTQGAMLWKVAGFACEDSPNVADLDGDGSAEIVGMTFGGEVFCLDGSGRTRWKKDLREELDDSAHAYMTPILCDANGDGQLEILAMTNGGYRKMAHGVVFVLSPTGQILDQIDVGGDRYWGEAFYANIDDDPQMELVVSGSGGVDVIETRGYGPSTEHFQRRRSYQRLNVVPWAYHDSYFIYRGTKQGVTNLTDNVVLENTSRGYRRSGRFVSELLRLPAGGFFFDRLDFKARTPLGSSLRVNLLDQAGKPVRCNVENGASLQVAQGVRIEFVLSTSNRQVTPILDEYRLSFRRHAQSPGRSNAP